MLHTQECQKTHVIWSLFGHIEDGAQESFCGANPLKIETLPLIVCPYCMLPPRGDIIIVLLVY